MTTVKRATLIFALLALVLLVLAYVWRRPGAGPVVPSPEPAVAAPAGSQSGAATPDPGTAPPQRYLVSVVLSSDPGRSRAHIVGMNATGMYKLQDRLPPDQAVLTSIESDHVTLQPPKGDKITLYVTKLSPEERFLHDDNFSEEDIESPVGDLEQPVSAEGRKALAGLSNPQEQCADMDNADEQAACEQKIEDEIERRSAECEALTDKEEMAACFRAAYLLQERPAVQQR